MIVIYYPTEIVVYGFLEDLFEAPERTQLYNIQIGYRKEGGGTSALIRGRITEVGGTASKLFYSW